MVKYKNLEIFYVNMSGIGAEAYRESLEEDAERYKKSKRNLFGINTFFLVLFVLIFLIPLGVTKTIIAVFILLVFYGFVRIYALN